MSEKILDVKNLHVYFDTYAGVVKAIRDVSFHVNKGESLAIVGESGSGKSVTVQTIMKLIPMPPGRIAEGEILFKDRDIVKMNESEMRKIRYVSCNISICFWYCLCDLDLSVSP